MSFIKFWKILGETKGPELKLGGSSNQTSSRSAGRDLKVVQPPWTWLTRLSAGQILIAESDLQPSSAPGASETPTWRRRENKDLHLRPSRLRTSRPSVKRWWCSALKPPGGPRGGSLVTAALIALVTAEAGEPCEVHQDGVKHLLLKKENKQKQIWLQREMTGGD